MKQRRKRGIRKRGIRKRGVGKRGVTKRDVGKRRDIPVCGCDLGSFTVEAAFVVPMVVLVITMTLHIGFELQAATVKEAEKTPAVEYLEPVDEMYRKGIDI